MPSTKTAPPKKTIAKKTPPKRQSAAAAKKQSPATEKKMLYQPAEGSDIDLRVRLKAVIAVLEDAPVSEAKASAAAEILKGVLKLV